MKRRRNLRVIVTDNRFARCLDRERESERKFDIEKLCLNRNRTPLIE